jgi:hypothetical protein
MSGINSMITRHGMDFHVQTQDKGKTAHYVESTVYKSGRVLSSRKTFYTAILDSPKLEFQINQIIEEQHSTILQEIEEGKFDHL